MTVPEILNALTTYTGRFPKQAMRAAIEQREAITPELLRVVEAVAEDPVEFAKRKDYMLHLFAMYLLAQFREKRAYPLFVKIFSTPGETAFDLAGDTVTERLSRILGSVYDGNPAPLQSLVESEQVNEYVRDAALDAFLVLEQSGQMPRDEVVSYYRSLFGGKLSRNYSHAWDGLAYGVAALPAPELLPEVRQAYQDGLAEPLFARLEEIEREAQSQKPWRREKYRIITDAIAEMEWWASFNKPGQAPRKQTGAEQSPVSSGQVSAQPVRHKKPWRNAPCPCGSGKKYKKCCGKI
jgi:Protein of unknown function (DUF1186)/SEC-C motif